VLELRLAYYRGYEQFLLFLGENTTPKPVFTLEDFEFMLRCMQLRKTTLVEAAKRFSDRSESQRLGNKCMALEAFCAFAMLHDFPTFQQLHHSIS